MKRLHLLSIPFFALLVLLLRSAWAGDAGKEKEKDTSKPWKEIYVLKPLAINDNDDKVRRLLIERYNEVATELKTVVALKFDDAHHPWYDEGLVDVSRRVFRTTLDFDNANERAALLGEVLVQVKELEQKFEVLAKMLKDSRTRVHLSRFRTLRLEIEFHIARAEKR